MGELMSHNGHTEWLESQSERILDEIALIPTLNINPGLYEDCVNFVFDELESYAELDQPMTEHLVIKYFASITKDIMSSQELETMARHYQKQENER